MCSYTNTTDLFTTLVALFQQPGTFTTSSISVVIDLTSSDTERTVNPGRAPYVTIVILWSKHMILHYTPSNAVAGFDLMASHFEFHRPNHYTKRPTHQSYGHNKWSLLLPCEDAHVVTVVPAGAVQSAVTRSQMHVPIGIRVPIGIWSSTWKPRLVS